MKKLQVKKEKVNLYNEPPNKYIRELLNDDAKKKVELAKKLEVSIEAIRLWTGGFARPEISKLPDIADYFGRTIDYLFHGVDTYNITTNKELGLSNKAIQMLKQTKKLSAETSPLPYLPLYFDLINYLIKNIDLLFIADYIYNFKQISDKNFEKVNAIIPTLTPDKLKEMLLKRTTEKFEEMIKNFINEKQKKEKGD